MTTIHPAVVLRHVAANGAREGKASDYALAAHLEDIAGDTLDVDVHDILIAAAKRLHELAAMTESGAFGRSRVRFTA